MVVLSVGFCGALSTVSSGEEGEEEQSDSEENSDLESEGGVSESEEETVQQTPGTVCIILVDSGLLFLIRAHLAV